MKKFITPSYTFFPGTSGVGYVEIDVTDFDIKKLACIINATRGEIICLPTSPTKTYSGVEGTRVNLNYDTSSHASDDILQFVYETTDDLDSLETAVFLLASILEKLPRVDTADREVVNVETGTVAVSSLPTLAAVTTVTTVSTVTTVGTVQNFNGGNAAMVPYHLSNVGALHLYDKISITP